jgi:hypothetical protein
MEPSYETVVDPATILFTMVAYALHGFFAASQLVIALYLLGTAAAGVFRRSASAITSGLRGLVGIMLLVPLLSGAPLPVSVLAVGFALVLFWRDDPSWLRRAGIAASLGVLAFTLFEREDPIALGLEVVSQMQETRAQELSWQLATDRQAPKVGEEAPDFVLEDPSGHTKVRLSDFRGKRPVALMFGSYT